MNLPEDFVSYTRQFMGDDLFDIVANGLDNEPSPTSVRLNPFKAKGRDVHGSLAEATVPWCEHTGRYLNTRPNFTFDPLLHAGVYYVQEAASMFVDYVVRSLISQPVCMLDLCAAPGGKSTALRAALPEGSLLVSNEPMRPRAQILSENMQKFGHEDVIVTNNYPKDFRKSSLLFDAILADVPCSGEGMFRKDDGARAEWSKQNVAGCWQLQRDIISDIWQCLKPGGLLIYSTCTFNAHEDEDNVAWIAQELGADIITLPVEQHWNITPALCGNATAYRFLPGVSKSEGLFLAILRKHGTTPTASNVDTRTKGKAAKGSKNQKKMPAIRIPLRNAEQYSLRQLADTMLAIPSRWADIYDMAESKLKIMHAGIAIGKEKGKDLIPSQSLALARQLDTTSFPCVEVDYVDAISYLRKEAVTLPADTPRGFVLLTYKGSPLGFEKNIGNRANNLYPQEWRIKSTHVPTEAEHDNIIE